MPPGDHTPGGLFLMEQTLPRKRNQTKQFRGGLAQEHQTFPTFGAKIDHEYTLGDITDPSFWHTQNRTLEPGARIRCEWECGSRTALLRVMGVDANAKAVLVAVESHHDFPTPAMPDGFSLEFINGAAGWRILEEGRRSPLRTGFPTAFAAAHWLRGDRGPKDDVAVEAPPPKPSAKPKEQTGKTKPATTDEALPA